MPKIAFAKMTPALLLSSPSNHKCVCEQDRKREGGRETERAYVCLCRQGDSRAAAFKSFKAQVRTCVRERERERERETENVCVCVAKVTHAFLR